MPPLTLKDVAKAVGLSPSTVSRVLNHHPDVASHTRRKVEQAIENLGYTPNILAKDLRLETTKTIGIVISDISNPYFANVVRGAENAARQRGYSIILCDTAEQYELEKESVELLLKKRVVGLLLTPVNEKIINLLRLKGQGVPFVLVARYLSKVVTNYVVSDDALGGYLATQHLIKKGHKRILHLGGPPSLSDAWDRLAGYKRALLENGIAFDQNLVKTVSTVTMDEAYSLMNTVLSDEKVNFTAIFCFSDYLAMGAIRAIRERGLKIPTNIAVVGYDDVEVASLLEVPLTTIHTPKYRLGKRAVEILIDHLLQEKSETPKQLVIKPSLVVRKSA